MPAYDYECEACGKVSEISHGITVPGPEHCPACGVEGKLHRLISRGGSVIFKGSGFYITDYKNAGKKEPTGPESEKKSASKSSEGEGGPKKEAVKESTDSSPAQPKGATKGSDGAKSE